MNSKLQCNLYCQCNQNVIIFFYIYAVPKRLNRAVAIANANL